MALALAALHAPLWAHALPVNPAVVAGTASFAQTGKRLTVTNSHNAIINWQQFNIAAGNTVRFNQPSASSSVLNRVLASDPSVILGSLTSNGRVWLVNPAGIFVGQGARIDVAGFVASTLYISNADFLANRLRFEANPGAGNVINQGTITTPMGGSVYLIGSNVTNEGIITTPKGETILAAGNTVELIDSATPGVKVEITGAEGNATNLGEISAEAGRIGIAGVMVKNSGRLNASSAVKEGGKIFLRATKKIELTETSKVGADGTAGGNVTAITTENGKISGELVGRGEISAQGNGTPGSGGFVETSAAKVKINDGFRVKTNGGHWLIDPNDYTIGSGGSITGATLSANLDGGDGAGGISGSNITILSSDGVTVGNGDIHVNEAISWAENTLTLTAARDININAVMTASGTAALTMNTATTNGADTGVAGGTVKVGMSGGSFIGRVNFPGRSGTGFLTINGNGYTVINSLGAAGSTTGLDLQGMGGNLAGHYALGSDIDASATSGWNSGAGFAPVGSNATPFTGNFEGLGHTVTGFTINRPTTDYVGLLGRSTGAIRNVGQLGGSVTGQNRVGGLVGENDGTVSNAYKTGSAAGSNYVGGLAGWNDGTLSYAYSTGAVTGTSGTVGGLVGGHNGTLSNTYSTSNATSAGSNVGGLVGTFFGGTISRSYSTGSASGSYHIGGLVGGQQGSSTISNSYSTGNATAGPSGYAGGLVGLFSTGTIEYSYSTGSVTGGGNLGGLVGANTNPGTSVVTASYWNTETSGRTYSPRGTGLTTAQMLNPANFIGWDLTTVWNIDAGTSYPYLRKNEQTQHPTLVTGILWDGGGALDNWEDPFNWSTDLLPTASDNIIISNVFGTVTLNSPQTANGLMCGADFVISSGSLTLGGAALFNGNLTLGSGAALTANGTLALGVSPTLDADARINITQSGAGILTIDSLPYTVINSLGAQGSTTALDLQGMNGNRAGRYALGSDIDASATSGWNSGAGFAPIGNSSSVFFSGKFNGLGHTISGLTINRPSTNYVGLFGFAQGADVRHVDLLNGSVTGTYAVGALAGIYKLGTIANSSATGGTTSGGGTERDMVGGLVGSLDSSTITNSHATRDVSGEESVGGLVGFSFSSGISNSYAEGTVTGTGNYIGGLVGNNNTNGTIANSHAAGFVQYTGSGAHYVGGLAGVNSSSGGMITNSYATGAVDTRFYGGGLVGWNMGTITGSHATGAVTVLYALAGGLVANNAGTIGTSYATGAVSAGNATAGGLVGVHFGSIINSHATGAVTSPGSGVGGLVGSMDTGSTIVDSYASGAVTGTTSVGGLTGNSQGNISNSHYNIEAVTINGANHVTRGGLYNTQYLDWLADKTLDISDYAATLALNGSYHEIANLQGMKDMLGFAENPAYKFRLVASLDLASAPGLFIPHFSANEFNGNGYTLSNLSINQPFNNEIGLFGRIAGSSLVTNLTLTGVNVQGANDVGGIAGRNMGSITSTSSSGSVSGLGSVGGLAGENNGTINNSLTSGTVSISSGTGYFFGGLVGYNYGGAISSSSNSASVIGESNVGGLVGNNEGGTISSSHATGTVQGASIWSDSLGGLVGGNEDGDIVDSYATGNVSGYSNVGGLVGYNLKNITNSHATGSVTGTESVGGLVGYNYGSYAGVIDNSYAEGAVSGNNKVGGLVGEGSWDTTISNSHAIGAVTTSGTFAYSIGGLVGQTSWGSSISNSYATGTVTGGNDTESIGGLVGDSYNTAISGSYSTGSVTSGNNTWYIGGLVGRHDGAEAITGSHSTSVVSAGADSGAIGGLVGMSEANITNSYSTGSVTGGASSSSVGGLVGENWADISNSYSTGHVSGTQSVGGLAGYNGWNITNAYSVGNVTGTTDTGGMVGFNDTGTTITNAYWNTETSAQVTSAGGIGLTTAQLKEQANFFGWDFSTVWNIDAGSSYPYLRTNEQTPHPGVGGGGSTCLICTWDGGGTTNTNWGLAANWTGDVIPSTGATVTIGSGQGTILFDVNGLSLVALSSGSTLDILSGKTLTLTGTGTFNAPVTGAGTLAIAGATVTSGANAINIANLNLSGGSLAGTGTLAVTNHFDWTGGTLGSTFNHLALTRQGSFTIGGIGALGDITLTSVGGDLTVSGNLSKSAGSAATLKLVADGSVVVNSGAQITSTSNLLNVEINGDRDASGAGQIIVQSSALINSNNGNITLGGGANPLTTPAYGINGGIAAAVNLTGSALSAGSGNISIRGVGSSDDHGIHIDSGATITTTTGNVVINGVAGNGTGGDKVGIVVTGGATAISSAGGAISLTGTGGGGTGANHFGMRLYGGADIVNAGTGTISLTGGGGGGTNAAGILINDSGTLVQTQNGSLTVTGTAGATEGYGVVVSYDGQVRSTGTGNVALSGVGSGASEGIRLEIGAPVIASGSGVLILEAQAAGADSIALLNGTVSGSGALTLRPMNLTTAIGLGGGAGAFNLTGSEISTIQSGFSSITIGRAAGIDAINLGSASFNAPVSLMAKGAGGAVNFAGVLSAPTLLAAADSGITLGSGATVTATAASGNSLVLDAGSGNFINNHDATALQTNGTARWLVYSANPSGINKGGISSSFRRYSDTYASYSPGSVAESGNGFIYASPVGGLTINAALSSGAASHTYGDTPTAVFGYTVANATSADNEDLALITGPASFSPVPNATSNAGAYNVSFTGGLTSPVGYTFTPGANLPYTVGTRALTVTADPKNMPYGNAVPTLTYVTGGLGLVNGDTLSGTLGTTASNTANVGSYAITQNTLAASSNYSLSYTSNNVTIDPRSLTVTANPQTMTYGDSVPTLTYATGGLGLVNGDTLSGALATTASNTANVGSYPITQGSLAASGNYNLTSFTPDNVAIGQRSLTVTMMSTVSKIYDGNTSVALVPAPTFGNVVNGDNANLSISVGSSSYDTRHAGSGKTVNYSTLVLGGSAAGNYSLSGTTVSGTGSISPLPSIAWTGGGGNSNWSNAANWGGIPIDGSNVLNANLAGNSVIYDAANGTTSLTSISNVGGFTLAGGTLSIGSLLTTPIYVQTGGLLEGAGGLTVTQSFSKSGGTLGMPGLLSITQTGGHLVFSNERALTLGAVSTLGGNIDITATGGITTTVPVAANGGVLKLSAHSPINVGSGGLSSTGDMTLSAMTPSPSSIIQLAGALVSGGNVTLLAYAGIIQNASITGQNIDVTTTTGNIAVAGTALSSVPSGGAINYSAMAGTIASIPANFAGATPNLRSQPGVIGEAIDEAVAAVEETINTTVNEINSVVIRTENALADDKADKPEVSPGTENLTDRMLLTSPNQTTGGEPGTFGAISEPIIGAGDTAAESALPKPEEAAKEAVKEKDEQKDDRRVASKKAGQCS